MRNASIVVYTYDELNEKARAKAMNDLVEFYLDMYRGTPEESFSFVDLAVKKANRMKTPWFAGAYMIEMAEQEILEDLRQYEYLPDGSIFGAAEVA